MDEGAVFAVLLPSGGYGVGVAARIGDRGMTLGYFSDRLFAEVPSIVEASFPPAAAIWIVLFGDLGIMEGRWPIVGKVPDWNRDEWPLPDFARTSDLSGQHFRVSYGGDLRARPLEVPASPEEVAGLPEAGAAGAGFVEERLQRLLEA